MEGPSPDGEIVLSSYFFLLLFRALKILKRKEEGNERNALENTTLWLSKSPFFFGKRNAKKRRESYKRLSPQRSLQFPQLYSSDPHKMKAP